jgi:uncharacterized protein (DUF2141 family)
MYRSESRVALVVRAVLRARAASLAAALLAIASGVALRVSSARASDPAALVELTVRVQGLKNDRGQVAVALFASASGFPQREHAFRGQLSRIERGRAQVQFRALPPGTYSVAVLHDENENKKMDFNFLGMPLEGYGFSNDASALFGPPSFERAAFRLLPRPSVVSITARYFSL